MKKVVVSVPGKIHLMGEHAVVYGKPAILSAIGMRLYLSLTKSNKGLEVVSLEEPKLINKAIETVRQKLNLKEPLNIRLEVKSDIPVGRHLGSSAAVAVGIVAGLTYFFKKKWDPLFFNELAYEVEKIQHGNPSGGDNSTCTFGGFIWFRKETEFLKNITPFSLDQPDFLKNLILVDTGMPSENTGEMVKSVSVFVKKNPQKAEKILSENEKATKELIQALKNNDEISFIIAIKKGERTLEKLGVVSKKAMKFIRKIEKISGAAKILGGGGKTDAVGFILVYHPKRLKVENIAKEYNYPLMPANFSQEGVKLEENI